MHGRLASSLHRLQAGIANRNPASSRRTAAAEHTLRHAHLTHDPLGHLSATGNEHTLPVRPGCLAVIGHFVLVTSGGLQDDSTSKGQCRESGHQILRVSRRHLLLASAMTTGVRSDYLTLTRSVFTTTTAIPSNHGRITADRWSRAERLLGRRRLRGALRRMAPRNTTMPMITRYSRPFTPTIPRTIAAITGSRKRAILGSSAQSGGSTAGQPPLAASVGLVGQTVVLEDLLFLADGQFAVGVDRRGICRVLLVVGDLEIPRTRTLGTRGASDEIGCSPAAILGSAKTF
jgi:hypothetical protein